MENLLECFGFDKFVSLHMSMLSPFSVCCTLHAAIHLHNCSSAVQSCSVVWLYFKLLF